MHFLKLLFSSWALRKDSKNIVHYFLKYNKPLRCDVYTGRVFLHLVLNIEVEDLTLLEEQLEKHQSTRAEETHRAELEQLNRWFSKMFRSNKRKSKVTISNKIIAEITRGIDIYLRCFTNISRSPLLSSSSSWKWVI